MTVARPGGGTVYAKIIHTYVLHCFKGKLHGACRSPGGPNLIHPMTNEPSHYLDAAEHDDPSPSPHSPPPADYGVILYLDVKNLVLIMMAAVIVALLLDRAFRHPAGPPATNPAHPCPRSRRPSPVSPCILKTSP